MEPRGFQYLLGLCKCPFSGALKGSIRAVYRVSTGVLDGWFLKSGSLFLGPQTDTAPLQKKVPKQRNLLGLFWSISNRLVVLRGSESYDQLDPKPPKP